MNMKNKIDVLSRLSGEMKEVLRIQAEMAKDAFDTTGLSTQAIRENYTRERAYWNQGGPVMTRTQDIMVPFEGRQIKTRIHCPNNKPVNPCIFYIHGGGMVVGNLDTHDRIMRLLAHHADCIVAGIDYSLSPEAKFPTALLECAAVVRFYRARAAEYGIDPDKMGLGGDSAGANLSLTTTLWLRDREADTSYIRGLLLYYGIYGMMDSRSGRLYGGPWDGLSEEDLQYYADMYFAKPEDVKSPYYSAYENDLTHRIPPCFILGAEYDPLLDDSTALYSILKEKGTNCVYREYKGVLHAFLHYSRVMKAAEDALREGGEFFKNA